MNEAMKIKGEGARLKELLGRRFPSAVAAAEFLGMKQGNLSRTYKRERMSAQFWAKYAQRLREAGLNPAYISDPENQPPFFEEVVEIEIAKLRERLAELETQKTYSHVHA